MMNLPTGIYQLPIMAGSRRNGGPRIMQERSLYKTIRDDLLRAIENGSLQPDQALPSERELCQRYGTSRMTVRHAVTELESLGSVYRMQGKGTFVSGRKLIQPLMQVSGFTEDMAKRGKKASSQILFAGEKKADAAIARGLRIAPGEPYILIRRLRLADGVPMAIEHTALNASLCRRENADDAIFNFLSKNFGITNISKAVARQAARSFQCKLASAAILTTTSVTLPIKS